MNELYTLSFSTLFSIASFPSISVEDFMLYVLNDTYFRTSFGNILFLFLFISFLNFLLNIDMRMHI